MVIKRDPCLEEVVQKISLSDFDIIDESFLAHYEELRKCVMRKPSEELLSRLEHKAPVFRFLVRLHEQKFIKRKQVEETFAILIRNPEWEGTLRSDTVLCDALPAELQRRSPRQPNESAEAFGQPPMEDAGLDVQVKPEPDPLSKHELTVTESSKKRQFLSRAMLFACALALCGIFSRMNSSEHVKTSQDEYHLLFIGNPGSGKSAFLNAHAGRKLFGSGVVDDGIGHTKALQKKKHRNVWYADTPGLEDLKMRKEAGKAIQKALFEGGKFKIVFFMTLNAGRVQPADTTTMKLVLDAAPINQKYGVIINKLEPKLLRAFENNVTKKAELFSKIMVQFSEGKRSNHLHLVGHSPQLYGEDDAILQGSACDSFRGFIDRLPPTTIDSKDVQALKIETFEEQIQAMEDNLQKQTAEHHSQMLEIQTAYVKDLKNTKSEVMKTKSEVEKLKRDLAEEKAKPWWKKIF